MSLTLFQYCPKIVVFSRRRDKVLLGLRSDEEDYNNVYSFFGGKLETSDHDIIGGISREKSEELGLNCTLNLYPFFSDNYFFKKSDGQCMIVAHFYAEFSNGEIILSNEYINFQWVPIKIIDFFEPKIPTIPNVINRLITLTSIINRKEMISI